MKLVRMCKNYKVFLVVITDINWSGQVPYKDIVFFFFKLSFSRISGESINQQKKGISNDKFSWLGCYLLVWTKKLSKKEVAGWPIIIENLRKHMVRWKTLRLRLEKNIAQILHYIKINYFIEHVSSLFRWCFL